jgi:hypothetical protein
MGRNHAIAIIGGLALGAFIGYEFAATLNGYPPYTLIANYFSQKAQASSS